MDGSNFKLPRLFGRHNSQRRLLIELAVVCGSPVLILAVILAMQIRSDVRHDTTVNAIRAAKTAVADPLGGEFTGTAATRPVLRQEDQRSLDELVARARESVAFDRVIVRDESGRILFSDDHRLIGKKVGSIDALKLALSGRTVYHPLTVAERPPFSPETPGLVVWSAPRDASDATPRAAIEMWVPTAPIDAAVADRVGSVYTALGGVMIVLWIALIFAVVNAIVGPILRLLGLPFVVLTLGLFLLVINAALLGLTAALTDRLNVDGFGSAVLGGLLLAIGGWLADQVLDHD